MAGLACALASSSPAVAKSVGDSLTIGEKRDLAAEGRLVIELLQNLQYSDRQFHEIDGAEIVTRDLKALDPEFLILTKDDVGFLHQRFDHSIKAVYLLKGNLQPAFEIFDYFSGRMQRRLAWVDERLKAGLAMEAPGTFTQPTAPAASATELDRRWILRLQYAVGTEILDGREAAEAHEHVGEKYRQWGREFASMDALAVRELFFDGLIGLFDPHSGYFSPEHAREFQILMQGSVGGVGLGVRMDEGRCMVQDVTPGGPAELSGAFQVGDELVALSDDGKTWRDITHEPLQKIVASLRGPAGTNLGIAVRTANAGRREVNLVRAQVVLAGDRARGAVVQVPGTGGAKTRVGWIDLPDFYASEPASGGASATRDVRELIDQMKARGVTALVIDLRKNPGGAMSEAVALSGLFLPSGTVAILRGLDGKPVEQKIEPAPVEFAGPLMVLTSGSSASASEMFAGAMSFHHRAVVVGEASTFGKGTAQDYIDLNKLPTHAAGAKLEWGTLRVTRGRFYFPDGRSPQRRGSPSDIVLPLAGEPDREHEADLPHALPEETVSVPDAPPVQANVARVDRGLLQHLRDNVASRASTLPEYGFIHRYETIYADAARKEAGFNVPLTQRRNEAKEREARMTALVRDVRAWAATAAYPTEAIEITAVKTALDEHAKQVRGHLPPGADLKGGWLQSGTFYRENASGALEEVSWSRLSFSRYLGDAADLAATFAKASGTATTPAAMESTLRALGRLEEPSDHSVDDCFVKSTALQTESDRLAVKHGIDAVFQRLIDLDPGLIEPSQRLDVARREALRLAADWAGLMAPMAKLPDATGEPKKL